MFFQSMFKERIYSSPNGELGQLNRFTQWRPNWPKLSKYHTFLCFLTVHFGPDSNVFLLKPDPNSAFGLTPHASRQKQYQQQQQYQTERKQRKSKFKGL